MNLTFDPTIATAYSSPTQRARLLTEHWLGREGFCPDCGTEPLSHYPANRPVADFYCSTCRADFELKSQARPFGASIADGAYGTMIERLTSGSNPNFFLLQYDAISCSVKNLIVIPKYFFLPDMIVARRPLAATARRAGWIGCKIMLQTIPRPGKIALVENGTIRPQEEVRQDWQKTRFLHEQMSATARGWLLHTMRCVERIGKSDFTLAEMYEFEAELTAIYPSNRHIRQKIRQQLQVLRDRGYLQFQGNGRYRIV